MASLDSDDDAPAMLPWSPVWCSPPPDLPPRLLALAQGMRPQPGDADSVAHVARVCTIADCAAPSTSSLARPVELIAAAIRTLYGAADGRIWTEVSLVVPWWALWFQIRFQIATRPSAGNFWMNNALAAIVNALHAEADRADTAFTAPEFLFLYPLVTGDVTNIARPSSMNASIARLKEVIHSRAVRSPGDYGSLVALLGAPS